jgi:hypothetical protein
MGAGNKMAPASVSHGLESIPQGLILEPDVDSSKPPPTKGATITKIRHGPYSVAALSSIENQPSTQMTAPCKECYITAMQAGLEYSDGSPANVDTGAWLHHMVLYNLGKTDIVCDMHGVAPMRLMASGNERCPIRVNQEDAYGFEVNKDDSLGLVIELMNQAPQAINVYLTMTYEWVPKSGAGAVYKPVLPIWLDVTNCGMSEVPAKNGVYQYSSSGWKSKYDGKMLYGVGHVHDGGTDVTLMQNDQAICRYNQLYAEAGGYQNLKTTGTAMGGMDMGSNVTHISDAAVCRNFGTIKKGDNIKITAHYNADLHSQMKMGTELHPVMGISLLYLGT